MKENDKKARALLMAGILILCCCVSIVSFYTGRYVEEVYWIEHIKSGQQEDCWDVWAKQNSYDAAFSEWENFKCTFDNKTLTLETECGGHGFTSITIFSNPKVNVSIDHWDVYKTVETWTNKNIDEIWIKDAEENTIVVSKEWLAPEDHPGFFDLINISVPVWNFYAPANTCTRHIIDAQDNISSNLTVVVRKEIDPFSYTDTIYRFKPVIYTFEVGT